MKKLQNLSNNLVCNFTVVDSVTRYSVTWNFIYSRSIVLKLSAICVADTNGNTVLCTVVVPGHNPILYLANGYYLRRAQIVSVRPNLNVLNTNSIDVSVLARYNFISVVKLKSLRSIGNVATKKYVFILQRLPIVLYIVTGNSSQGKYLEFSVGTECRELSIYRSGAVS